MRVSARYALWLLPFLLLGCSHKSDTTQTQALAPPIEDKPLPAPSTVSPKDLPPPVVGDAKPPEQAAEPTPKPPPAEKKPAKHPKKPAAAPPVQEAANNPAPSVSAIGELSSGASGDLRSQTADSIGATEKSLNSINRNLSDQEQKTAAQIREFLKQAKEALTGGDVDGAHTLAEKAKVLLAELNH